MTVERSAVPVEYTQSEAALSDRQADYILALVDERDVGDHADDIRSRVRAGTVSKRLASEWIQRLRAKPRKTSRFARMKGEMPEVPDGRYAIDLEGYDNLMFYRVKTGKGDTRWAGFMFVDAGRGGSHGDLKWTSIKNPAYKKQVLEKIIADGIEAAGERFGQTVGACYVCGRSLTDDTSRALGIGPDCRGKRDG